MRGALAGVMLVAGLVVSAVAAGAQEPLMELKAGDLRFSFHQGNGMRLWARGVSVIRESHVFLVTPTWSAALLNSHNVTPVVETTTEDGAQIGTATFTTDEATAAYRFEVRPDNVFRVTLTYDSKGAPATVETAAYLNATLISGTAYSAETEGGKAQGRVPVFATSANQRASRLTPERIHSARFETAIGSLDIAVEGNAPENRAMTLFDARAIPTAWSVRHPIFWFGLGSPAPSAGPGENRVTVTYAFGPAPAREVVPALPARVAVVSTAEATVPAGPDLPLIPTPKEMKAAGKPVLLGPGARVILADAPTEEEKKAAREIHDELRHYWHMDAPIVRAGKAGAARTGDIRLAIGPGAPDRPEAYALTADGPGVRITGRDGRGVYHGAQTLKQLLRVDGGGVYVEPAQIRDWPTLSWRGVHWFGGPESLPWHHRMIANIIAPLKYNNMLYEASFTAWDSQPGIRWEGRTTPKDEVRRTVAIARNHLLEPIPMVQSLGHVDWLFHNGQNMDIVADPKTPYAYDPDNPRTYEVIFGLFEEAIDLFQPKTFHIGHDEVELNGVFPPPGRTKTTTDYVIEDTNRLYDWLKARNLDVMMWGDMLLHAEEGSGGAAFAPTKEDAARRRAGIPKDILIADWHYNYSAEPEYPSVEVLQDDGFRVLGSTWFGWANIRDFAEELAKQNSLGMLQTTWAGFAMSMGLMDTQELGQFIAYVVAAEAAWNGGKADPRLMDYSPEDAFLTLWSRQPIAKAPRPGFMVDLSRAANAGMWQWMPDADGANRAGFPQGRVTLAGTAFDLSRPMLLAGPLNPAGIWPRQVSLGLDGNKADELHFLWGATHTAPMNTAVARVSVLYGDGTTVDTPITYGREIFAFTDMRARKHTSVAWRGKAPDGQRADARRWIWTNPHPEKRIARVTLHSAESEASPVLLALTGVNR